MCICRSWIATTFSVVLALVHTVVSVCLVDASGPLVDRWQQLAANILVFLAVNLVGLFIHNLTEEGQRRAFLDTRDCIAARLDMEDENEKLVRYEMKWQTYSYLTAILLCIPLCVFCVT